MTALLTPEDVASRLSDLEGWAQVSVEGKPSLQATFELNDFADALAFVNQVGHEAEQMNHHPDVDIRWNKVTLTLSTHSAGGLTPADIELAHRIASSTGFGQPL